MTSTPTTFPTGVEQWRADIVHLAPDLPIEFCLAWIKHESGGNPCSTGIAGKEAGIWQLYYPDDERYGSTFAKERAACNGQKQIRPLTPTERALCVTSGVAYLRAAQSSVRAQLAAAGASWGEDTADFWRLVKLRHGLPAWGVSYLRAYRTRTGNPPPSWRVWRDWICSLPDAEIVAINASVRPWSTIEQRRRLFGNAESAAVSIGKEMP